MIGTVEPWDLVAEGYARSSVKLFPRFAEIAMELAGIGRDDAILDVACGPGTLPLLAADRVRSVHAIDFSEAMIKKTSGTG
jgi:ubiquinone/menaquinone biosynthesis C-methylase UbiE